MKMKKEKIIEIIKEEVRNTLKEFITSNDELEILINSAEDINTEFFNGRGHIDRNNYRMAVRETPDNVINILEKGTKVIHKDRGFSAKDDQAKEYYQLPDFNVSISIDTYKVARASIIQFLSFDGELPSEGWSN